MPRPSTGIRPRILVAAREAFDQRGVDATSLRTIARAARTTMGMIYYYFATKDELYFAVVEEVYARVLEDFSAALGPGEGAPRSLRRALEDLMHRMSRLTVEDRAVVRIVLREVTVSTERRQRLIDRFAHGHIPLVLGAIARARATGELRAELHPAMIVFATGVLGAMSTLVLEHLPLPGLPRGQERIAATLDLLFAGVAVPATTAASSLPSPSPSSLPSPSLPSPSLPSASPPAPPPRATRRARRSA